jgi:hypothetical protein
MAEFDFRYSNRIALGIVTFSALSALLRDPSASG